MSSQTKDIVKNTWGLAFPCDLSLLHGSLLWFLLSKQNHTVMSFDSDWYVVTTDFEGCTMIQPSSFHKKFLVFEEG
jgi:hypothetical protein